MDPLDLLDSLPSREKHRYPPHGECPEKKYTPWGRIFVCCNRTSGGVRHGRVLRFWKSGAIPLRRRS